MAERRDRIQVHIEDKAYSVVGGAFREMLAAVKQINGRRFVNALKVWQLPGTVDAVRNQLDISGFQLEGGAPIETPAAALPRADAGGTAATAGNDRIRITVQGHSLAIVGGTFQEMLVAVKNLPGRRFDGNNKIWEIPGELSAIKQLIEAAGFQLEGADKIPAASKAASSPASAGDDLAFEPPQFITNDEVPPYEPPDWWDDDNAPPPPAEPPGWWDDDTDPPPPAPPPDWGDDEAELPPPPESMEPPRFDREPASASPRTGSTGSRGGDQIRIRLGGIPLVVSGGAFREMLAAVKNVPGRRFNGAEKVWELPAEVGLEKLTQQLEAAGFSLGRDTG